MSAAVAYQPAEAETSRAHPETETNRAWARACRVISDGPLERCIGPLLDAIGWRGDATQIIEAMPHFDTLKSINDLRLVLHRMGLHSTVTTVAAATISNELLPAILLRRRRTLLVLERRGQKFRIYDAETETEHWAPLSGELRVCSIRSHFAGEAAASSGAGWFKNALFRISGDLNFILALSLGINLLVLALPIFTMGVYTLILPAEGWATLPLAAAAAIAAVALEFRLRRERALAIATASARISNGVSTTGFQRVLTFPYAMLDKASISGQIGWLKQFDTIMTAYSGPVCAAIMDLPFILLMLLALGLIGGPLVIPTVAALIVIAVATLLLTPAGERSTKRAASAKAHHTTMLREMLNNSTSIREAGLESIWLCRMRRSHRDAVGARIRAAAHEALQQNICIAMIALCSVATLAAGAMLVMDGALGIGALIAVTMLSGRIFGPVQTVVTRLASLSASRSAAKRFEALLDMDVGRPLGAAPPVIRTFRGALEFRELSFKHADSDGLALRNISARFDAGSIVGLVGPSGSGQSTLLKLAAGLYKPSTGSISVDGVNLAQLHAAELRGAVAFAAKDPRFFYGTLAQNMRLADPAASDEEIEAVLLKCGVPIGSAPFGDGLQTRLSASGYRELPAELRRKLTIARALVKDAAVSLFDLTSNTWSAREEQRFAAILRERSERGTVLLATSRPALLETCDLIMGLRDGNLLGVKTASEALKS